MAELMWFVTRASGVVALLLIVAAVADGLVFSGREGGRRLRPAGWMDLHRGLGGYALAFTGLHLVSAFGADLGVGLAEIFVPGASSYATTAFSLGVLAFYGLAVTVLTSWPKKRLRHRAWHALHLVSLPTAVLSAVHAYQLGSDARTPVYLAVSAIAAGLVMYPAGLRVSGLVRSRRAAAGTRAATVTTEAARELVTR
jgi:DMSO/TMAO reductase YedYZ heme-binding membrane subunit